MTATKSVHEAFADVMAEVSAIAKSERNTQQGFTFRGIDNVMDAVGPALRKHRVFVIPKGTDLKSETYLTRKEVSMRNVTVTMTYTVYGPAGDSFSGVSYGEAADAGDKAVTKAQSVAYRTFLLQSLSVPTGDPDPDASTHERVAPAESEADQMRTQLLTKAREYGWNGARLADRFREDHGTDIRTADAATVDAFAKAILKEAAAQDGEEVASRRDGQ